MVVKFLTSWATVGFSQRTSSLGAVNSLLQKFILIWSLFLCYASCCVYRFKGFYAAWLIYWYSIKLLIHNRINILCEGIKTHWFYRCICALSFASVGRNRLELKRTGIFMDMKVLGWFFANILRFSSATVSRISQGYWNPFPCHKHEVCCPTFIRHYTIWL
jgi:hypothetical protein